MTEAAPARVPVDVHAGGQARSRVTVGQIEPDWASIHRELKRKYVTLSILWDEYVPTAYTGSSVA